MNNNFLEVLRENRSLLLAVLIVLGLSAFIWFAIAQFFGSEPEELILPTPTSAAVSLTVTVSVSDPLQANFTPAITRTGTVTPIVLSTFTPRTGVPLMTATDNDRPRPTSTPTPRPTNTRRPPPSLTSPPTNPPLTLPPRPTATKAPTTYP